jgi:hypothetical protein
MTRRETPFVTDGDLIIVEAIVSSRRSNRSRTPGGYASASATLIAVTARSCQPCKVAKSAHASMRRDSSSIE